jgi:hypothetical protein
MQVLTTLTTHIFLHFTHIQDAPFTEQSSVRIPLAMSNARQVNHIVSLIISQNVNLTLST